MIKKKWTNYFMVEKIYDFCMEMVKNKNLHPNFQGERKDEDIFLNLFQGKIAELAVLTELKLNGHLVKIKDLDLEVRKRNNWDNGDIFIKNKFGQTMYIDVKSIKGNSKNLLIETFRYYNDGSLSYDNSDGTKHKLDAYALVRVNFNKDVYKLCLTLSKEEFLKDFEIETEFIGGITNEDFWKLKKLVPRGTKCFGKNFEKIWKGQIFDKEINEDAISSQEGRTRYIQTDNYMVPFTSLFDIDTLFVEKLHIKKQIIS